MIPTSVQIRTNILKEINALIPIIWLIAFKRPWTRPLNEDEHLIWRIEQFPDDIKDLVERSNYLMFELGKWKDYSNKNCGLS